MEKIIEKLLMALRLVSGISFLTAGIKLIRTTFSPQLAENHPVDTKLGELIYKESLARGDPEYLASFYRTDTLYPHRFEELFPSLTLLIGLGSVVIALCIFSSWACLLRLAMPF
jgi:hypothetical protein